MLIVSGTSRAENRRDLARQCCQPRVPLRLATQRSRLALESLLWREYWRPCRAFFEVDLRLVQRLNRLKKAWLNVLQHPADRLCQMAYCWRYFGLLHHAMRIASDEPRRPDPLSAIRRIVGFEALLLEAVGEAGTAACAVDLPRRADSFIPIDRFTRLVSERPDPCWKPRARLLARRLLAPLLDARHEGAAADPGPLCVLDLGAGTGQLLAKAWTYLARMKGALPQASFHFVDANPPAFGRSFGLSRERAGVTHVEGTTADYRALADDDQWLRKSGPFGWVFACRVLDNASNFMIEPIEPADSDRLSVDCLPHRCLAPRSQPDGIRRLRVSTVRRQARGGTIYPQYSLRDYFTGMLGLQSGSLDVVHDEAWHLPVRRFNPAALITPSGRSLLAQLMKVSGAVIIEDVDAQPEHFRQHRAQFGLPGTAAVFCTDDGFRTEANHFVVTSPEWARSIRGERLW